MYLHSCFLFSVVIVFMHLHYLVNEHVNYSDSGVTGKVKQNLGWLIFFFFTVTNLPLLSVNIYGFRIVTE